MCVSCGERGGERKKKKGESLIGRSNLEFEGGLLFITRRKGSLQWRTGREEGQLPSPEMPS